MRTISGFQLGSEKKKKLGHLFSIGLELCLSQFAISRVGRSAGEGVRPVRGVQSIVKAVKA